MEAESFVMHMTARKCYSFAFRCCSNKKYVVFHERNPESTCAAESSPEVGQPVPASQDCEKPDAAVGAGVSPDPRNLRVEQATIKAQAAFRGYLFVSKAIGADLIVHAKHWREVCRTAHDSGLTSKAKDITIAASCLCPAPVSLCVYTGTSCRELQLP